MAALRALVLVVPLVVACGGGAPTTSRVPTSPAAAPSARAPKPPVPLAEYYNVRRVPGFALSNLPLLSFSFDETKVAYVTDEGGRIDIWVRPISGEGAAVQVSHVEGFVHSFAFSPREDLLVFEADRGGDELPRLYATDSTGAAARELVPELPSGRRTQFVEWAKDGATFLYLANGRDETAMDLLEYDLKTRKSAVLWQASGSLGFSIASADHRRFVLLDTHSDTNTDLYLLDRGQKSPVHLTKHEGEVYFGATEIARDGKTLLAVSDEGGEFTELFSIDLTTGKRHRVYGDTWDVESATHSPSGKYFVIEVNENGTPKLVVTANDKPVTLPAAPGAGSAWRLLSFSKTDRYVGLTLVSDTSPATSFVANLETGALVRLVDPLPASLRDHRMVAGDAVLIPSFDGKQVPAFVYKPPGAGPFPAIIDVHGGPTAQSKRAYIGFRQYAVSKGYVVLVPNVRGSTGYGKSYLRLDNLDLGGGPLQDIVACKRWLVQNAAVAADRVVVMGGSYGGYMALAAEAFTPDEFVANVDFFGFSDLKSVVESFPAYWASQASFIHLKFGDPKNPAHAAYQHDRSPLNFVSRMKRPLLVVQGDTDARVKKDQSDRIVASLRERKVPVHYLVLENEGHGFSKTESSLKAYALTDRFLDRYVFGDLSVTDLP